MQYGSLFVISPRNVTSVAGKHNFSQHLIFINLKLNGNSHKRLVAPVLDSAGLKIFSICPFKDSPQLLQAPYLSNT